MLEDLISVGEGLDIAEHVVGDDEGGPLRAIAVSGPVVAVIRGDDLMRFDDPDAAGVQAGDRVVFVRSNRR